MTDGTEGEVRYAYSKLTDTYYRVTDWDEAGDGKIVAKHKEEIGPEEIPDDWWGGRDV